MILGTVAAIIVTPLSGAWITFGLPLKGLSFWVKLIIGVILSPFVVAVEFFLLRYAGISFDWTSILLVLLNLPALYLIIRQGEKFPALDRKAWVAVAMISLIILTAIAPFLLDAQKRLYTWEAWSQSDMVYSLANGNLNLQDAELVGIRLSYPWLGAIYQAVVSYLSDSPPMVNYIWQNLVWLVCMFGLMLGITAELGGNKFSQVTTTVWLSFCVNIVGVTVQPWVPQSWIDAHAFLKRIWGDNRYTPWLDKVVFLGQMYFGLGLFTAILYLLLKQWPQGSKRYYLLLIGLLLFSLGLIYPILLPIACILVGAKGLFLLHNWLKNHDRTALWEFISLSVSALLAVGLTFAMIRYLTQYRADGSLMAFNERRVLESRILEALIVTSPLLLGLAAVFRSQFKKNGEKLAILGFGALGSMILYILFNIPWFRNEYKFIFTAAICLAPFLSLALESFFTRLKWLSIPVLGIITILLALPFFDHIYNKTYELYTRAGPVVDVSHFAIRLADSEPLSGLIDAIRQKTPSNSILVIHDWDLYYPTLTERQLYAPPEQSVPFPGILISSDEMITQVEDYSPEILKDRRAVLDEIFTSSSPQDGLLEVMKQGRPVAIILDDQAHIGLKNWLIQNKLGQAVYRGNNHTLWTINSVEIASFLKEKDVNLKRIPSFINN